MTRSVWNKEVSNGSVKATDFSLFFLRLLSSVSLQYFCTVKISEMFVLPLQTKVTIYGNLGPTVYLKLKSPISWAEKFSVEEKCYNIKSASFWVEYLLKHTADFSVGDTVGEEQKAIRDEFLFVRQLKRVFCKRWEPQSWYTTCLFSFDIL